MIMNKLLIHFCTMLVFLGCLGVSVDVRASGSAEQVVYAQLEALQRWDGNGVDEALREVWDRAHPENQKMTGPIDRFARLLTAPGYQPLIGHQKHEVVPFERNRSNNGDAEIATFSVIVLATDGLVYGFVWQLGRAELPDGKAWMTLSVSPARSTGKQLSRVFMPMKKAVSLR